MCHCLPKHFWWPYCYSYAVTLNWELITRDQIILPILAHSSSPGKLSQLPQQMLSHPSEWSTPHFGVHMIYPGTIVSIRRMLSGSKSCCKKNMGHKYTEQKFSHLTPSFVQHCGTFSRNPLTTLPYYLTLQDLVLCVSSSLPSSLPQAQLFGLAGKPVISIKMCSIFIGLTLQMLRREFLL